MQSIHQLLQQSLHSNESLILGTFNLSDIDWQTFIGVKQNHTQNFNFPKIFLSQLVPTCPPFTHTRKCYKEMFTRQLVPFLRQNTVILQPTGLAALSLRDAVGGDREAAVPGVAPAPRYQTQCRHSRPRPDKDRTPPAAG